MFRFCCVCVWCLIVCCDGHIMMGCVVLVCGRGDCFLFHYVVCVCVLGIRLSVVNG